MSFWQNTASGVSKWGGVGFVSGNNKNLRGLGKPRRIGLIRVEVAGVEGLQLSSYFITTSPKTLRKISRQ